MSKTQLARQFNCCWEISDRRLNPKKYQKDKKERRKIKCTSKKNKYRKYEFKKWSIILKREIARLQAIVNLDGTVSGLLTSMTLIGKKKK